MSHALLSRKSLSSDLPMGQVVPTNGAPFEFGELIACALDCLSYGVVLLDEEAMPIFANSKGAALIDQGRLPLSHKATVHRADPIEGIRHAIRAFDDESAQPVVTCRVGEPALICTVARLPQQAGNKRARAILFVTDSEHVRTLQPGEAALAVEFANGHRLQTCANRLGISLTTAKTHLQRIFAKTGVSRQTDLMRLILTSTPALRPEA
jgi:DNA-binding CsgD family transcriptional regulator